MLHLFTSVWVLPYCMGVLFPQLHVQWLSTHKGLAAVHSKKLLHVCNACAGYEEFAGKLIGALQDAIEADLSDMEERQVSSCPCVLA